MSNQSSNRSSAPVQRTSSSRSSSSAAPARTTPSQSTQGAASARITLGRASSSSTSASTANSSAGQRSSSNSRWDAESRRVHTSALTSAWKQDERDEQERAGNAAASTQAEVRYRGEGQSSAASEEAGVARLDESRQADPDLRSRDKSSTEFKSNSELRQNSEFKPNKEPKPNNEFKQNTEPNPNNEVKPNGEVKPDQPPRNDPFGQSRSGLLEAFQTSKVLDEQSMQRMTKMMGEFENRMASLAAMKVEAYQRRHGSCPPEVAEKILAESKQKINDTYKHLTEMVGTGQGSGELFSQADRASLAEGLMFHLADPRTFDQGSNGTCWINSSTASYGLMTQPDDMARFMKEISLTGQFQAFNNGQAGGSPVTIRFNKGMFYSTSQERNWKISNALGGSARSPVGMFLDEAMTEMVGKRRADAGNYEGQWGAKRIMTMITGEVPPAPRGRLGNARTNRQMTQEDLNVALEYGGFQIYSPGHLQSVHFVPEGKFGWGENGLTYNGNAMALDGSAPMSGYFVLDNQWGERSDFVTHYVNGNGQIQDIQDQRFQHFDPGKVSNERNITIRPGNDSNGGGGGFDGGGGDWDGGGGGGGFGEGGLLGLIGAILQAIFGGGGANLGELANPENWLQLLEELVNSAEGECESGEPGQSYDLLEQSMPYLVGAQRPAQEVMERIHAVLAQGSARRQEAAFPDLLDVLG